MRRTDVLFVFAGHGPLDPRGMARCRMYVSAPACPEPQLACLYRASDRPRCCRVSARASLWWCRRRSPAVSPVICGSDTATADALATPFLTGIQIEISDPETTAARLLAELTPLLGRGSLPAERRERAAFARTRYSWAASGARYADLLRRLCAPFVPLAGA